MLTKAELDLLLLDGLLEGLNPTASLIALYCTMTGTKLSDIDAIKIAYLLRRDARSIAPALKQLYKNAATLQQLCSNFVAKMQQLCSKDAATLQQSCSKVADFSEKSPKITQNEEDAYSDTLGNINRDSNINNNNIILTPPSPLRGDCAPTYTYAYAREGKSQVTPITETKEESKTHDPIIAPKQEELTLESEEDAPPLVQKSTPRGRKRPENASFELWWGSYPPRRKSAKKQCFCKFEQILKSGEATEEELFVGLMRWINSNDWQKEDSQYIPAPLVWLNQSRWQAEPKQGYEIISSIGQYTLYGSTTSGMTVDPNFGKVREWL